MNKEINLFSQSLQTSEQPGKIIAPFQSIKQAVKITGCSEHFLREGVKSGNIPHLKNGTKYLINVPALLAQLDEISKVGGVLEQ